MERNQDPYAPPPRHKDRSGAVLRVAIIAALLGLGAWGYTEFASNPGPTLTENEQTTTLADSSMDQGYVTTPETAAPASEPAPAAPAPAPAAPERSAPAPQPAEPAPPPSTTIGAPPG